MVCDLFVLFGGCSNHDPTLSTDTRVRFKNRLVALLLALTLVIDSNLVSLLYPFLINLFINIALSSLAGMLSWWKRYMRCGGNSRKRSD